MDIKNVSHDIVEALTSLSKLTLGYIEKCKEVKEKDQIIALLQKNLSLSKEAEENTRFQNNCLLENLNKMKDMMRKSVSLESEITKLIKEKRAMEKCFDHLKCRLAKERDNWAQEKRNLLEKFQIDLNLCKENNKAEVLKVHHNVQRKNIDLQRKLSALTYELSLSKQENQEVLSQTRKIWEEKLKKKDEELKTAENELNYWRKKNFSSISMTKGAPFVQCIKFQNQSRNDERSDNPLSEGAIDKRQGNSRGNIEVPSNREGAARSYDVQKDGSQSDEGNPLDDPESLIATQEVVLIDSSGVNRSVKPVYPEDRGEFHVNKRSPVKTVENLPKPKAIVSPRKQNQTSSVVKKRRLFNPKNVPDF